MIARWLLVCSGGC